jgi:hypothetical protein
VASSDILGLVQAQAAARERLTTSAVHATVARTRTLDFYDSAAITAAVEQIVAHVEAAQRQTAALTDAYLSRITTQLRDRATQPAGAVDVTVLRAGVRHDQVYGRLADNYRYLRSTGVSEADALTQTLQRAEVMAATDVDLAMRAQAARFAEVHHLQYRRVLHPELSRHGSCGLCVAASDRVYTRGKLMPIHARCKCEVLPIVGSKDPGHSINKADLDRLYAAAGGTTAGEDLKRVRVTVRHHGELGPVLTRRGQHFRGPDDIAA